MVNDHAEGLPLADPPKSVVIAGAGAVRQAWRPVRRALLRRFRHLPEGTENAAFASIVLELRHLAQVRNAGWRLTGARDALAVRRVLRRQLSRYDSLCEDIARELADATTAGEIGPRPEFEQICERWVRPEVGAVVTTNWDRTLGNAFPDQRVFHVHGDVRDAASLYLPMEQSWEPYRKLPTRTGDLPRHNGRVTHGNWLVHRAEQVVVYGLSLSPIDAELSLLFRSLADPPLPSRVIVIDPNADVVASRISFYVQDRIPDISTATPDALSRIESGFS